MHIIIIENLTSILIKSSKKTIITYDFYNEDSTTTFINTLLVYFFSP